MFTATARQGPFIIVVLPGDGIGPEVMRSGTEVLLAAAELDGFDVELREFPAGEASIQTCGQPLPDEALAAAKTADAVLLGAVGSPVPPPPGEPRPEDAILLLRTELDTYANLRPAACPPELTHLSGLRPERVAGTDIMLVREVTGGMYFNPPEEPRREGGLLTAVDVCQYDDQVIRRVVEKAFDLAAGRRGEVVSVDKANILRTSRLWRKVAEEVAAERPEISLTHLLVDAAAAALVQRPGAFDVVVTENMFGDILSDMLAIVPGSIGMMPSATIGDGIGLYEPVHGSAPDIAGQGVANPAAMIGTVALMLRHALGRERAAEHVEAALANALRQGAVTRDVAGRADQAIGTVAFTERVMETLARRRPTAPEAAGGRV